VSGAAGDRGRALVSQPGCLLDHGGSSTAGPMKTGNKFRPTHGFADMEARGGGRPTDNWIVKALIGPSPQLPDWALLLAADAIDADDVNSRALH